MAIAHLLSEGAGLFSGLVHLLVSPDIDTPIHAAAESLGNARFGNRQYALVVKPADDKAPQGYEVIGGIYALPPLEKARAAYIAVCNGRFAALSAQREAENMHRMGLYRRGGILIDNGEPNHVDDILLPPIGTPKSYVVSDHDVMEWANEHMKPVRLLVYSRLTEERPALVPSPVLAATIR